MSNKMRLIDANGSFTLNAADNTDYGLCFGGGIISVMDDLGRCVCEFFADDAPTVDAVPVVHGEWSVIEDDWEDEVYYECSICKKEFAALDEAPVENLWNYCPNCGAKMDGDENG